MVCKNIFLPCHSTMEPCDVFTFRNFYMIYKSLRKVSIVHHAGVIVTDVLDRYTFTKRNFKKFKMGILAEMTR